MIVKKLAIRCNKCYNVIESTGTCYCEALAVIYQQGSWFIYTDDEDYSLVSIYTDNKNRKIKIVDVDAIKKASVILPASEEALNSLRPANVKRKDI